jgi:hypothetical protein
MLPMKEENENFKKRRKNVYICPNMLKTGSGTGQILKSEYSRALKN